MIHIFMYSDMIIYSDMIHILCHFMFYVISEACGLGSCCGCRPGASCGSRNVNKNNNNKQDTNVISN